MAPGGRPLTQLRQPAPPLAPGDAAVAGAAAAQLTGQRLRVMLGGVGVEVDEPQRPFGVLHRDHAAQAPDRRTGRLGHGGTGPLGTERDPAELRGRVISQAGLAGLSRQGLHELQCLLELGLRLRIGGPEREQDHTPEGLAGAPARLVERGCRGPGRGDQTVAARTGQGRLQFDGEPLRRVGRFRRRGHLGVLGQQQPGARRFGGGGRGLRSAFGGHPFIG